jgi:hypothetical protein
VTAAAVEAIMTVESGGVDATTVLVTLEVATAVLVTVAGVGDGPKLAMKLKGLLAAAAFL